MVYIALVFFAEFFCFNEIHPLKKYGVNIEEWYDVSTNLHTGTVFISGEYVYYDLKLCIKTPTLVTYVVAVVSIDMGFLEVPPITIKNLYYSY